LTTKNGDGVTGETGKLKARYNRQGTEVLVEKAGQIWCRLQDEETQTYVNTYTLDDWFCSF